MGNTKSTGGNAGGLVGSQDAFGNGINTITSSYRYQLATINGVVRTENTPNGVHGGIKTMNELLTKTTYTDNSWLFVDSTPVAGPWYWDGIGYPKLSLVMTITPVITINTQPAANTTFTQGSITGSLSVSASVTQGATLSYQWYSNTTNSNTGGNAITGATNASFTIPINLTASGSPYYYFCEVRAAGATSVRSNVATVTVLPATIPVTGVTVTPSTTTIEVGATLTLTVNVTPVNATDRNVTWSSSNTAVATVNSSGVVTAVSAGTVTITARSNSNPTVFDTCTVTVEEPIGCNAIGYGYLLFALFGVVLFVHRRKGRT